MKLPSGREIFPNRRIIGIDDEGETFEGYDGSLTYGDPFSPEDRKFIAETMVGRWADYGELDLNRERDLLATAIAEAAKKAGIYNGEVPLTGPQLLLLCDDLATCAIIAADLPDKQP